MKSYTSKGNKEAAKAERDKLSRLRKMNGIYPSISMLNLFQLPAHLVFISLINKLAYDPMMCPSILTDGFFWFTDLSSPDPYGILPVRHPYRFQK